MIAELAQLASRKLSEARVRARQEVRAYQDVARAVVYASQQYRLPVGLGWIVHYSVERDEQRLDKADYAMSVEIAARANGARAKVMAMAEEAARAAALRLAQQTASIEDRKRRLPLPLEPRKLDHESWLGTLGSICGGIAGALIGLGFGMGISQSLRYSTDVRGAGIVVALFLTSTALGWAIGRALPLAVWNTVRAENYDAKVRTVTARVQGELRMQLAATTAEHDRVQRAIEIVLETCRRTPCSSQASERQPGGPRGGARSVVLRSAGDQRIQVMKALREWNGMSLDQAKEIIERVPSIVASEISEAEAVKLAWALQEQGAVADVR